MDLNDSEVMADGEQDEPTTAAEVVQKLEEVWVNEKLAPELLNYEGELVDCLLDQIQHMEASLLKIKKEDFRYVFHEMEVDRIRFVLRSYLRSRLEKIEKFGAHLLTRENDLPQLMSEEEKKFCQAHVTIMKNYLHNVALQHMPSNMQSIQLEEIGCKPQLNRSVFIRAKKDCGSILLESGDGDNDTIGLPKDSQYILRYRHIASLVKTSSVQLI